MVNKKRLQIVILSGMVAMTLVQAHEGHVHGEAPPQETAQKNRKGSGNSGYATNQVNRGSA